MTLRDYQIEIAEKAVSILKEHQLCLLNMQPRTGKTLTALSIADRYYYTIDSHPIRRVLFVTKKKAISSIQSDFIDSFFTWQLDIINYEQLKNVGRGYDFIIIDEYHSLGAFPIMSQRVKYLRKICAGVPVVMLSGTPTPESFAQMFHAIYSTDKGIWKQYHTFYKWAKDYVNVKQKFIYNRAINDYSDANIDKIQADLKDITISYTQVEAGFNNVCEDVILKVPMPASVRASIELINKHKIFTISSGGVVLGDTAVKRMGKIHQLCSGTVRDEDGKYYSFDDFKARFIKERFKENKIAIFYKYIAEREHLINVFGQVIEDPEEFNLCERNCVFISQVMSGREGVNLATADCLVMYNIDFSALSYLQSRERLQSKDRVMSSKVYWIMTDGGIEEKIYNTVKNKENYTLKHYNRIDKSIRI